MIDNMDFDSRSLVFAPLGYVVVLSPCRHCISNTSNGYHLGLFKYECIRFMTSVGLVTSGSTLLLHLTHPKFASI